MTAVQPLVPRSIAVLGGGCFWCLEPIFAELRGVTGVTSGYAGGALPNPTYEAVCTGVSGHAEVVRVEFDAATISFATLLEVFFASHDPTTRNRQGNDIGTQYRSVVFCQSPEQEVIARATLARLENEKVFGAPIVTEIALAAPFYPAEGYHQQYFALNGHHPYCSHVIAPKIAKARKRFAALMKPPG